MRSRTKYFLLTIIVIFLIVISALVYWILTPYKAGEESLQILEEEQVSIDENGFILFRPNDPSEIGIIFYPGGRVEAEAYAIIADELSSKGYITAIVEMPLNLAVTDPLKGEEVVSVVKDVGTWIVVGHSLGGSMAARLYSEVFEINKLVLLASYPENSLNLSQRDGDILSIVGSKDKVVDMDKVNKSLDQLPKGSELIVIEGGNHSQFGDYGNQSGDGEAEISRGEQIERTVEEIIEFIEN